MRARASLIAIVVAAVLAPALLARQPGPGLPARLSDTEFWAFFAGNSEPNGFFRSDNLTSNEMLFQHVIGDLVARTGEGNVYLGVGPEQNLSYIAEVRPAMAFIVDVRLENRSLHLFYKALFELSTDRADFISRLFSRERPVDLDAGASVEELFTRYATVRPERRLREENGRLIRERLLEIHKFPLSPRDQRWIDYAFDAFYADGPAIHYARLLPNDPPGPSYRTLMTAKDVSGQHRSFLASEMNFELVKNLETANLIVPIIGDFGGPSALKRAGEYVREHNQIVTTFYSSNVEVYLNREKSVAFCRNLIGLPHDWNTYFVWSKGKQPLRLKLPACAAK